MAVASSMQQGRRVQDMFLKISKNGRFVVTLLNGESFCSVYFGQCERACGTGITSTVF